MTIGQLESYVATVFSFGHRTTIAAGTSTYLAETGGTNQSTEITVVVPRDGTLTNLYWDCQTNGLTGIGNKIIVKIGAAHPTPISAAPALTDGLVASLDGRTNSAVPMSIPVVAGQRVGVLVSAVAGGSNISRLRVSFELQAQRTSSTWQMDPDGATVFYDGGNVGIGTPTPGEALSVDGVIESETGGFKFPDGSVQTTAAFGGGGSSEITESGGNFGIGIDVTRNAQERLTLGPASNVAIEMPTPQGVTATASPAVGGLEADDYFFRVAATDGAGWTKASDQLRFDLVDPAHGIRISWNAVPGATKYRVFRALTATGAYKYIETSNTIFDYVSGSAFTAAGAPPEETTAYINKLSATGASWIAGGNVGIGTTTPQAKLDVAGAISGFGIVPIGSIIAWHKSLRGTPALPNGWVECNGQTISDGDSPYNGQGVPDLNGERRFLRGSDVSGKLQDDQIQSHKHVEPGHQHYVGVNGHGQPGGFGDYVTSYNGNVYTPGQTNPVQVQLGDAVDLLTGATTLRVGNETRPINMSVIWIMRIR